VTEAFATPDGRTSTYELEGSGPVLVCHPGGSDYSAHYLIGLGGLVHDFTLVKLGHLVFVEAPGAFREAVRGFLAA